MVAVRDRIPKRPSLPEFLPNPFIDKDVRIDRHPDGQDHSGDTGKGERRMEKGKPR